MFALVTAMSGCFDSGSSDSQMGGFFVHTNDVVFVGPIPLRTAHPGVLVTGSWNHDLDSRAVGSELTFDVTTDFLGQAHVADGRIEAVWDTGVFWNTLCGGVSGNSAPQDVTFADPLVEWDCVNFASAAASPSFALAGSSPPTLSVQTTGLSTAGGMPQLRVYDQNSTLVSSNLATSVSAGGTVTTPTPMVTEYYANQVIYSGHTIPTGSEPVAIKAYGSARVWVKNTPTFQQTRTGPSNAIVVNSGSNSVSILNLAQYTVAATVGVGSQPLAVAMNSAATKAYVVNYGSGTVSEVDLLTSAVTRTASVGTNPASITMDPTGAALWVGGAGYLKKVDLTSFAVTSTIPVSGNVTSLAASNQQNELLYTTVSPTCCSGASNYTASDLSLANLTVQGNYGAGSAATYASYSMNNTLPNPGVIPGASLVSAQWSNGLGASATPTGFVIYDLIGHKEVMRGTTATPVRGIGIDPNNWVAYFSVPDSNQLVTVPLPH